MASTLKFTIEELTATLPLIHNSPNPKIRTEFRHISQTTCSKNLKEPSRPKSYIMKKHATHTHNVLTK
jgi:hypothetical protein